MRKFLFLLLVSFGVVLTKPIIHPSSVNALTPACQGIVKNPNGTPLALATVKVVINTPGNSQILVHTTDKNGRWQTASNRYATSTIQSIKVSDPFSGAIFVTSQKGNLCERCDDRGCIWSSDYADITLPDPGAPSGWNCENPSGTTSSEKCGAAPVPGGEHISQAVCVQNCQPTYPSLAGTYSCAVSSGQCTLVENCSPGYTVDNPNYCSGVSVTLCGDTLVRPPQSCVPLPSPPASGEYWCEQNVFAGCFVQENCATGYKVDDPNYCNGVSTTDCKKNSTSRPPRPCVPVKMVTTTPPPPGCVIADSFGCPGGTTACKNTGYCCADVNNCSFVSGGSGPSPKCTPAGGASDSGIETAVGCIPLSGTNEFTQFVLRWAMGIGGGIAFLMIVYSGFLITTAAGNPGKVQAGKELLTAAIAGLLLIILSAFILRVIGKDLLNIPGF